MSAAEYAASMSKLDAITNALVATAGPSAYLVACDVAPIVGLPGWRKVTLEFHYTDADDQPIATKETSPVTTTTTPAATTTPPTSATLPPGFYVCNDPAHEATGYAMFRKRHATYDEAQREAERLAKANAQPFYVLRVLAKAEPEPLPKPPAPAVQVVRESEAGRWEEAKRPARYGYLDFGAFGLPSVRSVSPWHIEYTYPHSGHR